MKKESGPSAVPVQVTTVQQRDMPRIIQGIGSLETPENAQVAAKTSGEITGIHFAQGDSVEQGDLLFTIEHQKEKQRLQARKAALTEANAEFQNARRSYQRRRDLLQENLVSRDVVDEAKTAMETAQARVAQIQADVTRLRETLQDTRIVAPIAGTADERQVDKGDFVDVGDPLVTIVNTRDLQVAFSVPERYASQIHPGQPVAITTPLWPERTFQGEIFFVSPRIGETTRDLLIKATIEETEVRLLPGGFVSVEVTVDVHKDALVVPEDALVPTRTGYQIFVVENGKAHKRDVEIGLRRPGLVEIQTGLNAGETVITQGHINAYEGAPVKFREKGSGKGAGETGS